MGKKKLKILRLKTLFILSYEVKYQLQKTTKLSCNDIQNLENIGVKSEFQPYLKQCWNITSR